MNRELITTNQNSKLALTKAKNLMNITKGILSKKDNFKDSEIINKNPAIYTKINSVIELSEQKKNILDQYKVLIDKYYDLFEKVENELDDNTIDSLEIIGKLLENRQKRMDSAFRRFVPDDSWDVLKIQEEFSHVLVKVLKDILESTSISISNGLKQSNVYKDIIKILNSFYTDLGIYTKEYKVGEVIDDDDWDNINNVTSQDDEIKDDKNYQNKIKSVESLAYLFDEDVVILEASISIWRIS